jgi:hypothetical protein
METAKTLGVIVAIVFIVALVAWEQRPQSIATETPTPTPIAAMASSTPLPLMAGWQWVAPASNSFHVAYPDNLFTQGSFAPVQLSMGSTGITLFTRLLGPRGYFTVGTIPAPFSATTIVDSESVRDITPISTSLGSGVRYVLGNNQCSTTAYRFPLNGETLRLAWSACNDHAQPRMNRDTNLQNAILQTLSR